MRTWIRRVWETDPRNDPNSVVYILLALFALTFPIIANVLSGGAPGFLLSVAGDAGVYVLLALGLNVVVGMAGLLDLDAVPDRRGGVHRRSSWLRHGARTCLRTSRTWPTGRMRSVRW